MSESRTRLFDGIIIHWILCMNYSELCIARTYMTLLVTIAYLVQNLSSTLVLYIANWLPKPHAYPIEVGAYFLFDFIWIGLNWTILRRLDGLPVKKWYLKPSLAMSMSIYYEFIAKYY
jgi:hypothetical protein